MQGTEYAPWEDNKNSAAKKYIVIKTDKHNSFNSIRF